MATSGPPGPQVVAKSLIKQYYQLLAKSPGTMYKLYKEGSRFLHAADSELRESVMGQESIGRAIEACGFNNTQVDLTGSFGSLDCQESINGGIVVMLTGLITINDHSSPRKFAQTFLLSPQAPKGYYIVNDIFRFLEPVESEIAPVVEAPKEVIETPVIAAPVEEVAAPPAPVEVEPIKAPVPVMEPEHVEPEPVEAVEADAPVAPAVPKEEPVEESVGAPEEASKSKGPVLWSSLFSAGGGPAPAAPARTAPPPKRERPAVAVTKKAAPVAAAPASLASPATTPGVPTGPIRPNSIFVKGIPPGSKDVDLQVAFKEYGRIAKVDIHQKRADACFAFVDFAPGAKVVEAIAACEGHRVMIGKTALIAEHARERRGSRFSGSRRGGGRGGRSEGDRRGGRRGGRGAPE